MAVLQAFPCPPMRKTSVVSSFWRRFIPGTRTLYGRARRGVCCPKGCSWGHGGNDIHAKTGMNVVAPWDGTIRLKSFGQAYGGQITVVARDNYGAFYAHLSHIGVREGEHVKKGQYIGRTGNTGRTSGPHLHFEIRRVWNNWCTAIDPNKQLNAVR